MIPAHCKSIDCSKNCIMSKEDKISFGTTQGFHDILGNCYHLTKKHWESMPRSSVGRMEAYCCDVSI